MGYKKFIVPAVKFRTQELPKLVGPGITVDNAVVDSTNGLARTSILRPGFVVVKRASTGRYVAADDVNGDRNLPASVTALITADATFASKQFDFVVDGGVLFSVTVSATDDTDAEIAAAFNADTRFRGELIADVVAARVRVRTLQAGRHKTLKINAPALATAYGASGTEAVGSDADYRVLGHEGHPEEHVDLLDTYAVAQHAVGVRNLLAGYFSAAALIKLTAEARVVLGRNGSLFAA